MCWCDSMSVYVCECCTLFNYAVLARTSQNFFLMWVYLTTKNIQLNACISLHRMHIVRPDPPNRSPIAGQCTLLPAVPSGHLSLLWLPTLGSCGSLLCCPEPAALPGILLSCSSSSSESASSSASRPACCYYYCFLFVAATAVVAASATAAAATTTTLTGVVLVHVQLNPNLDKLLLIGPSPSHAFFALPRCALAQIPLSFPLLSSP